MNVPATPKSPIQPRILDLTMISRDAQYYCSWPTVTRTHDGKLLVVCSGGRRNHHDPFGQVHLIESVDDGDNWSWHWVLADGPLDDRDAGIMQTRDGTLLVNWFTSYGWRKWYDRDDWSMQHRTDEEIAEWKRREARVTPETRDNLLGGWIIRSTDGGMTWSKPIAPLAGSPHGPTQLDDGSILYVGNKVATDDSRRLHGAHAYEADLGASVSYDDGQTWRWLSDIPLADCHSGHRYHEPHAVQAADGRVIVHIRNHDTPYKHEILQTESADGGKTWSTPHPTGIAGLPAHLLRLRDGRLISTVGYRKGPNNIRASVSDDNGDTWSDTFDLTDDGPTIDVGYPATVELDDGRLLTVFYQARDGRKYCAIYQVRWRLGDAS